MANPLAALDLMTDYVNELEAIVMSGRAKHVVASSAQPTARAIAKTYFESARADLITVQNRAGLSDEIDWAVQAILELATKIHEWKAYVSLINELRPYFLEASVDLMKAQGTPRLILSEVKRNILETLSVMLPSSKSSYEQALLDLAQGGTRVSWRGTAVELREMLREVIDHLAPDDKVMKSSGFQLESGHTRPTQKQKIRFILKARGSSSSVIEKAVAKLARATYQLGSVSTHVGTSGQEIKNMKRYIDALLAELLEIT